MRNGPFLLSDPIGLTLAARSFRQPEEADFVWQLELRQDGPLALRTSLNLQAQSFSIFPHFTFGSSHITELKDFFAQPKIDTILQDYVELVGNPTETVELSMEYLAEDCQTLICRTTVRNLSDSRLESALTLNAYLASMGSFPPIAAIRVVNQTVLKAQTGNLSIAIGFDADVKAILSPLPGLSWKRFIEARQSASFYWRLQATNQPAQLARELARPFPANWEAKISRKRVEDLNQGLKIICEDPEWQLVFDSAERQALQLVQSSGQTFQHYRMRSSSSSLLNNSADSGMGIGRVKTNSLNLYQLCLCLLPAHPQQCEALLDGALQSLSPPHPHQTPKLTADLPMPILANLCWRVFKHTLNRPFLALHYPLLKDLVFSWFDKPRDKDVDGLPEWAGTQQTGISRLPFFDLLNEESYPSAIWNAESSGLAALLELELEAIALMAHLLEDNPSEAIAQSLKNRLSSALEAWLSSDSAHGLRSYNEHRSPTGNLLYEGSFSCALKVQAALAEPSQLCLQLYANRLTQKPKNLLLKGRGKDGKRITESIPKESILWLPGLFFAQSEQSYSALEAISISPAENEYKLRLYTPDYSAANIMQLLTLLPQDESQNLKTTLAAQLGFTPVSLNYGIPENLTKEIPAEPEIINLGWNALIMEHLIRNGQGSLAYQVFSRLVGPVKNSLKNVHTFFEHYEAESGKGCGNLNHISGLLPLELLLDIAGIRVFSAEKVAVLGENSLPWPLTIRYQGMELTRDGKNTQISFSDGSSFHHYGSSPKTFTKPD
ncbi:MAG: hypothetical protein VB108_10100 [Anaerolineaceae bacterium]|nr:hypothetical protein [Anaerolineaceae bacterium]